MLSRIGIKTFTFHHRFAAWTQSIGSGSGERMQKKWIQCECSIAHSIVIQILLPYCKWCQQCKRESEMNIKKTNVNAKKSRSSHNKINGVIIISFSYAFANKTVRSTKLALVLERRARTSGCTYEYFYIFLFFSDSNWHVKSLINTHRFQRKLNVEKKWNNNAQTEFNLHIEWYRIVSVVNYFFFHQWRHLRLRLNKTCVAFCVRFLILFCS